MLDAARDIEAPQSTPMPDTLFRAADGDDNSSMVSFRSASARRMTWWQLGCVAFTFTAGGPFGLEAAVRAGGPLVALSALLAMPLIYVIAQIVIVVEMATMMRSNHGSVRWVQEAFGNGIGFFNAMTNVPANLIDAGVYPTLFTSYLVKAFIPAATHYERIGLCLACIWVGTGVALISATAVGNFTSAFTFVILIPFAVAVIAGFHYVTWEKISNPHAIYAPNQEANYGTLLSTLLWMFTGWRSLGSLGGEVRSPKDFLLGLFAALVIGEALYFFPLLVALAVPCPGGHRAWSSGYLVVAFDGVLHGLGKAIAAAGAIANLGLFASAMLVYPRTMWGVADKGWLPVIIKRQSKAGTPWVAVLIHAAAASVMSLFDFTVLVRMEMLIAAPSYIMSVWCLARLRWTKPDAGRPFKWPKSFAGSVVLVSIPSVVFVANFALNIKSWYLVVAALSVHASIIAAYFVLRWHRNREAAKLLANSAAPPTAAAPPTMPVVDRAAVINESTSLVAAAPISSIIKVSQV